MAFFPPNAALPGNLSHISKLKLKGNHEKLARKQGVSPPVILIWSKEK